MVGLMVGLMGQILPLIRLIVIASHPTLHRLACAEGADATVTTDAYQHI
jgi:hypothetical protein